MADNEPNANGSAGLSTERWLKLQLHRHFWRVLVWPVVVVSMLIAVFLVPQVARLLPDLLSLRFWYLLGWGLIGAFLLLRIYWAGLLMRRVDFGLDEQGYYLNWGVWWRSETRIPYSRIQYVDVNHGPLERYWGLASLAVHTAGTRAAVVVTPGVPLPIADALRDRLLQMEDGDGV